MVRIVGGQIQRGNGFCSARRPFSGRGRTGGDEGEVDAGREGLVPFFADADADEQVWAIEEQRDMEQDLWEDHVGSD